MVRRPQPSAPRTPLVVLAVASSALVVSAPLACVNNPVHDDEVDALGPEDPAVPAGPLHRPGQPCVVCHGPFGPASVQFSVGGTAYEAADGAMPAVGAAVRIEDSTGASTTPTTNVAGNFYVLLRDFNPAFPLRTSVTSADGNTVQTMQGYVARNGSCASCHTSQAGPTSAGPVNLSPSVADAATKG
jgi:hypothetical protein